MGEAHKGEEDDCKDGEGANHLEGQNATVCVFMHFCLLSTVFALAGNK